MQSGICIIQMITEILEVYFGTAGVLTLLRLLKSSTLQSLTSTLVLNLGRCFYRPLLHPVGWQLAPFLFIFLMIKNIFGSKRAPVCHVQ